MNNEEKILAILVEMQAEQRKTTQRLEGLEAEQKKTSQRLEGLEADVAEIKTTVAKVAVTQENVVLPRIQLLAEGHTTIQEQIRNLSVIDRLQDDVSTLKSAVRMLTQEIEELKAAM